MKPRKHPLLVEQHKAVITSDTLNFNCTFGGAAGRSNGTPCNAIWVGTSGNVNFRFADAPDGILNDLIYHSVVAGTWISMPPFSHIYTTGTSAANIRVGVSA